MKKIVTKILTFLVLGIIILSCNAEKRVRTGEMRLIKNEIFVNNKLSKSEEDINQIYQKPNTKFLGLNLRLQIFNLSSSKLDTSSTKFNNNFSKKAEANSNEIDTIKSSRLSNFFLFRGIHNFFKNTGEAPVIIDSFKTKKSVSRLQYHYFNKGYFNVKAKYKLDSIHLKKGKIKYQITKNSPFSIDTLSAQIKTLALDSLYNSQKKNSLIVSGNIFNTIDFENEKERISTHFRNSGVYHFQPNFITYNLDTLNNNKKVNIELIINNFSRQEKDSTVVEPFKIFKISKVNIYTDYSASNLNKFYDSIFYNDIDIFSNTKLKFKPKAISNAVFINKGSVFSDLKTVLTTRYLNNLKVFNYPTILYEMDKKDSTAQSLIAKIYLTPKKKYSTGGSFSVSHSNIQDIGISGILSTTIRNVFKGAETLELSTRANIGSSRASSELVNSFFNIIEYGFDAKLNFPRIWLPFKTEKIIPKSMIPSTLLSTGYSTQTNIGLDRQNVTAALAFNWNPKKNNSARFDILNMQYVRNLNSQNYFNIYKSSYSQLNALAKTNNTNPNFVDQDNNLKIDQGTNRFINEVINGSILVSSNDFKIVNSIKERRERLSSNDFILASTYTFSNTTRQDLKDHSFYQFRTKLESAGTFLSLFANLANSPKNSNNNYEIFNLEYSEYFKTEFDYIKYWALSKENVFAFRSFFGIAIPYGNSKNIPFIKSYFAGGSNDNRAWEPYRLGPGSSVAINDFNEANLKIALSAEFRFKIAGRFKGALFVDAGNIWNVFDDVADKNSKFNKIKDIKKIGLGTGFGLRYDLDYFIVRIDTGFKTYNPANELNKRWFNDYDFVNSVFNFGINYPF